MRVKQEPFYPQRRMTTSSSRSSRRTPKREESPRIEYEIQMLYNIREPRQFELAKLGYRVRVYVSYGVNWFPWLMRRLAERPANLLEVMRNVFRG